MELKSLIDTKLKSAFPNQNFQFEEFRNELTIIFDKSLIRDVCDFLKNDSDLLFTLCEDITAIDWAKRKNRFTVVYFLFSLKNSFRLKLKTDVDEAACRIDSVTSIWKSANFAEREVYDMYGIEFNDHPDLRRIYMPEDFEYFPLRKEFPVMGIPNSLYLPSKD